MTATGVALRNRLPALVLAAVPALLILTQLGSGRFLFGHDATEIFYFTCGVLRRSLSQGRLPVWDSTIMGGMPLLAALQYGVLYPPSWLFALLKPGAFWTVSVAVHLSLCGFFAHAWLTRGMGIGRWGALTGASAFMLSGYFLAHVFGGHLSLISAVPWIPAILWRLERLLAAPTPKRAALLAAVFLMLLLAGHPHTALLGGIAVVARLIHFAVFPKDGRRARMKVAAIAVASFTAGGLLSAPLLLPAAELAGRTQRGGGAGYDFATSYSLPPEGLLTLIAPTFFGDSTTVPYWGRWLQWEVTGFIGISTLALALIGALGSHPQRRLWSGLAIAGLILAMGQHTPLFRVYYALMPGAESFRVPARYLFLFGLSVAPLAALGFERLWTGDERLGKHSWAVGIGAAGLVITLSVFWLYLRSESSWKEILATEAAVARGQREEIYLRGPKFEADSRIMASNSLGIAILFLAGLTGLLLSYGKTRASFSALALAAFVGVELLVFDARMVTDHSDESMVWPDEVIHRMDGHLGHERGQGPRYRVATVDPTDMESVGKCRLAGIDHIGGYDPMMLKSYLELMRAASGSRDTGYAVTAVPARPCPITDLLGAKYWLVPGPKEVPVYWRDGGRVGDLNLYENPFALNRVFLVGRAEVIPDRARRLEALSSRRFQPSKVVVLEQGSSSGDDLDPDGYARLDSFRSGDYGIQVETKREAWLVLTEAWYPGWTATVDDVPAEILRADHFVQALKMSPGKHEVRFQFRSGTLRAGSWIAFVTLIAGSAALAAWRMRRHG